MTTARGGRPAGPERLAILAAVHALQVEGQQGGTWRELARRAQVGYGVARRTCWNLVTAGYLVVSGYARQPGQKKPCAIFSLPSAPASGGLALQNAWLVQIVDKFD